MYAVELGNVTWGRDGHNGETSAELGLWRRKATVEEDPVVSFSHYSPLFAPLLTSPLFFFFFLISEFIWVSKIKSKEMIDQE